MKKILTTLFVSCVLFYGFNVNAASSGICGATASACSYTLDDNGQLTVTGNGEMTQVPWSGDRYSITSVVVGDGITSVANYAFFFATNLTSVTLPDSVTSIGQEAFSNNYNLSSINVPASLTTIGAQAFDEARSLTSFVIPSTVTSIGGSAFYNTKITQDSLVNMSPDMLLNGALRGMSMLTGSFTIPEGTTSIVGSAFSGTGLSSVIIPDSVTSIGTHAFSYMKNLTAIEIPDSVASIGDWAFYNLGSKLESIKLPNNPNFTTIGSGAFYGNKITSLTIPDSVTTIKNSAFEASYYLTDIVIPDSVTSIGDAAFSGVSAKDLAVSAENLQRYLDARGGFKASGDINLQCSSGDCLAVLEAWDAAHNTTYASRAIITAKSQQVVNADGSTSVYENGQLVATRGKRIYTVEEASRLSKETGNTFKLRYK